MAANRKATSGNQQISATKHLGACRDEESVLVEAMQSGLFLEKEIERLHIECKRQPTTAELEAKLGLQLWEVSRQLMLGLRAKHVLVHANKRLVFKAAHKFGWEPNFPFEDCVMVHLLFFLHANPSIAPPKGNTSPFMLQVAVCLEGKGCINALQ